MLVKIQGEIGQLTDYIHSIFLQGTDLSALYILKAKLTLLLPSLPIHRLLSQLFSQNLQDILKAHQTFTKANNLSQPDRDSYSSHLSLSEVSKLRFKVSQDADSTEELLLLSQQILESLEEWAIIVRKSKVLSRRMLRNSGTLKEGEIESSFSFGSKDINEAVTESPSSSSSSIEDQQPAIDPTFSFIQYLSRWSNQLQREIFDFKMTVDLTKDNFQIDLAQDRLFRGSKIPSRTQASKTKMGSMSFERTRVQKKVRWAGKGCPQCCTY